MSKKQGFSIATKLVVATTFVVLGGLVAIYAIYQGIVLSNHSIHKMSDTTVPTAIATYEMKINVAEMGMGVMNYLRTGTPAHTQKVADDFADFQKFRNQYQALSTSQAALKIGNSLDQPFDEYAKLAFELLHVYDQSAKLQTAINSNLLLLNELLDTDSARASKPLQQIENELDILAFGLEAYLYGKDDFRKSNKSKSLAAMAQIKVFKDSIDKSSSSILATQPIFDLLDKVLLSVNNQIKINEQLRQSTKRFLELRAQLGSVLDNEIQIDVSNSLLSSITVAHNAIALGNRQILIFTPLFLLLAIASGIYIYRGTVHPIRRLMEGTDHVTARDLSYRLPSEGGDEFAQLAQNFNQMVATLESTTVSKTLLEQSEERFRTLVEGVRDFAIFTLDTKGRIATWNIASERILGFNADQIQGVEFANLYSANEITAEKPQKLLNQLAEGSFSAEQNSVWMRANGSAFDVNVVASKIPQSIESGFGVSIIARDITARQQLDRALKSSLEELATRNRELHDFAFVASHDLQEPLRKIRLFCDRLQTGFAEQLGDIGKGYLDRCSQTAERMQRLIDSLLAYSSVASREKEVAPTNLQEMLESVLEDFDVLLETCNGKIELAEMPTIEADAVLLRQVFQNLIGNALKYAHSDRAPHIEISAQPVHGRSFGSGWEFRIKDNGIGFDNCYTEKIFTPFQRLHNREEYEGTGIGLSIVRRIVDYHQGEITAQGEVGVGATFVMLLPTVQAKKA